MRKFILCALAGASLATIASTATAQTSSALAAAATAAPAEDNTLGEIVVTARRKSESLQEVPQTVNAVTADTLQKLNIRQFADIQTVVPGLTLAQTQGPVSGAASMRGVTYNSFTGAQPSVAFYLNDAPLSPPELFQSLFDIGQVEVLKGPQGTIRGTSSPSGAITVTTHKPNLSDFGGYVDVTLTDLKSHNVQGAINVPIIKDVLAVRAAGVIDENPGTDVRSIHSAIAPKQTTSAERISVSFEPTDAFNANVVYQHFDKSGYDFTAVEGPGQGTASQPALTAQDRASVQNAPGFASTHLDFVDVQVDSRLFGQHLSYTGGYRHFKVDMQASSDIGDQVASPVYQNTTTLERATTQEVRLSSDPAPGRFFDYVVGAFYRYDNNEVNNTSLALFLPGATPDPNSALLATTTGPNAFQETSLFGNVTLHFGPNTELSGGVRHIWSITNDGLEGFLSSPAIPGFVSPLDLGGSHRYSATPNIYNISLSHHFTRDLLAYFTTGTAFRPAIAVPVPPDAFPISNNPNVQALAFHPAETSRSFEVGLKSTWLDDRARVNIALYRQSFDNLSFLVNNILVRDLTTGGVTGNNQLTANANAIVKGLDLDAAFQITHDWNVSLQYSYAHSATSSPIPCNTGTLANPNFNTGDQTFPLNGGATSGLISFCNGGSPSLLPLWSLSAQSEYTHPVTDAYDGFIRGQLTYYPENKYVEPGSGFAASSYGLLNLFAGLRSHDGAWEVSVFARNLTYTKTTLDLSPNQATLGGAFQFFPQLAAAQSGYYAVNAYTPPREVGVNLHYAWGSR